MSKRKIFAFFVDKFFFLLYNIEVIAKATAHATVAQQVEQLTRNEQVVRSNRISSSKKRQSSVEDCRFFFLSVSPAYFDKSTREIPSNYRLERIS